MSPVRVRSPTLPTAADRRRQNASNPLSYRGFFAFQATLLPSPIPTEGDSPGEWTDRSGCNQGCNQIATPPLGPGRPSPSPAAPPLRGGVRRASPVYCTGGGVAPPERFAVLPERSGSPFLGTHSPAP